MGYSPGDAAQLFPIFISIDLHSIYAVTVIPFNNNICEKRSQTLWGRWQILLLLQNIYLFLKAVYL